MNEEMKIASQIPTNIRTLKQMYGKGLFVEVGAGCPVYNELCKFPNTASKLVYLVESPNDWSYNQEMFKHKNVRAISADVLKNIIEIKKQSINNDIDYVLTNTIQIGNTEDTETHGWFGIYTKNNDKTTYYHFTIPKNKEYSRPKQLDIIGKIGINLLIRQQDEFVDIVLDENLETDYKLTLFNIHVNSPQQINSSVVFAKNGDTLRLTEFLRKDFKKLVLFKGAFDPIHDQHIEMMKSAKRFAGLNSCYGVFCISILNREIFKQGKNIDNIIKRIKLINDLGYSVIIDRFGYFKDTYETVTTNPSYDKKLAFVLGADTFERFLNDNIKNSRAGIPIPEYNCDFYYSDRSDITIQHGKEINSEKMCIMPSEVSSTAIRTALANKDTEKLKELVSGELYNEYRKIWVI